MTEPKNKQLFSLWQAQQDVEAFHRKFGLTVREHPSILGVKDVALRASLHHEEVARELHNAMMTNDLVEVADAIADSIYVLLGTAVSYGIDLEPVWQAVQKANMAKEGGGTRADGKILKPEGWRAPNIRSIIEEQIREGRRRAGLDELVEQAQ